MTEQDPTTGQFAPTQATREQRVDDAALKAAMLLDDSAPTTVAPEASTAPVAAVEPEGKPDATVKRSSAHDKAIETLVLAGLDRDVAEGMTEAKALKAAAHRHKVDADAKAKVTRLNELEALLAAKGAGAAKTDAQAPAEIGKHPVSSGQGPSFVDAAKPVADVLGLGDEGLPILTGAFEQVAKAAAQAVRDEFAERVNLLESIAGENLSSAQYAVREGLAKRFPQLNDEAQAAEHQKAVESLLQTPFFQNAAPTYQGRLEKAWEAAAMVLGWQPPAPPATRPTDTAKRNGQPHVATQVTPPRRTSPMEEIDAAALRAAQLVTD